ncbi:MAG: 50S ribosomal protein L17 [Candidatus Levybacteria bacterium]|nr:50S ribosomal protein L17 [Candidatus Levybacteria bacterium]
MKKNVFGRKFKRDVKERKALFKSLLSSLVLNERIKTTEAKAKAIKAEADKLISKARREKKLAQRLLSVHLYPEAVEKVISEIAPRFENRKGGYVRIVKLGERLSDNARMAIMEWVEKKVIKSVTSEDKGVQKKTGGKERRPKGKTIKKQTAVKKKPEKGKTRTKKSK